MAGPWGFETVFRESGVPYAITDFPDGGAPFAGVQGFMVNAFSENVLLAQAFLTEFVATEEVMSQIAVDRASAYLPVLDSTDDAWLQDCCSWFRSGIDASYPRNGCGMGLLG